MAGGVDVTKSITVQFNGAEYLELSAKAGEASLSLPDYVVTRCGIEMWRVEAGRDRPRRGGYKEPVRLALERRGVMLRPTEPAYADLKVAAIAAGLSIPQYIRTRCGFPVRGTSRPHTYERDREEDEAWDRLRRLGLKPEEYFPPEE